MDLGQKVLLLRTMHGESQVEAAERCRVDKSVIARLEVGGTTSDGRSRRGVRPEASTLERIAEGYGVPLQYLTKDMPGYMAVFIAAVPRETRMSLRTSRERVKFVLQHLEQMYGHHGNVTVLASHMGFDPAEFARDGDHPQGFLESLSRVTGVPTAFFRPEQEAAMRMGPYEDVLYRLVSAGVPPEALELFLQGWLARGKRT